MSLASSNLSSRLRLTALGGGELHVDGDILLELLQSLHDRGVALEQVWSEGDDDGVLMRGAVLMQEERLPLPYMARTWFEMVEQNEKHIGSQEAGKFRALHERWQSDEKRHALCKQSLSRSLLLRLLAFIADLVDYRHSQDAQERMDHVLPTAKALFDSPLYFPDQPLEGKMLMSFVAPTGLTVSQTMAAQFERAPHLEGVCTAHTLAPLLKRLFAISDDASSSKEFKEFRAEFNRAASVRVRSSGSTAHTSPAAHRSSNKQHQKKEKAKSKGKNRG